MTLKELRKEKGLTQSEAAAYVGVSLRTYQSYEGNAGKQTGVHYEYILEKLTRYGFIDEENGVLTIENIKEICLKILPDYQVQYCYLFGSYAKGKATCRSDVDLLVFTDVTGLRFFELAERLREALHKRVDLLDQRQIEKNFELTNEILKDGIKIYG